MVRLTVHDSGIGMDAATCARIFEPLFTTKAGGTGMGLASVAQIVRAHGGRIACVSAPKSGTSMAITLPRAGIDARFSKPTVVPPGVP